MYVCTSCTVVPLSTTCVNCNTPFFVFQPSLEFPDPGLKISGLIQLGLFSPLRKTPPLQRSRLSSSEAWIQIPQCGYQSEPPPLSHLPRDWVASKVAVHEDCDLVSMFLSSKSQRRFGFHHQKSSCTFQWAKSKSRGSLILWAKCFAVSARSNLSWAKFESLIQADLYLVASSLFRIGLRLPSNTSLSCSFSRGVLTVFVFALHPDSLMMSGACLKSGSCPSTVQFDPSQL